MKNAEKYVSNSFTFVSVGLQTSHLIRKGIETHHRRNCDWLKLLPIFQFWVFPLPNFKDLVEVLYKIA